MSTNPALMIEDLTVSVGDNRIVDGLNLTLRRGQCLALLGESGSGKSMTARAVLGILPANTTVSGKIVVNGTDVTHARALARPLNMRPAMVMQDTLAALNPLSTIGHQIEQPLRRQGYDRRAARRHATHLLERVGLPDPDQILRRFSPELSGGQRQRVCIAIALASNASVIIADEPTSALDVVTQAQILRLLRQVVFEPDGPAILFITHDLHAAAHLCHQALVIQAGRVVENGTMQEIFSTPRHAYTRHLIGSAARCGLACDRLYA